MKIIVLMLLIVSSIAVAENRFDTVAAPNSCTPVAKRKPSKAYLERMKRCRELEVEVAELRKAVAEKKEVVKTVEVSKPVIQKNHLRLLGGVGPTGVGLDAVPGGVTLTKNYKPVLGAAYGRNLSDHWSVEGSMSTNATTLIGIGYNW